MIKGARFKVTAPLALQNMDIKRTIINAWNGRDSYTGLSILEAACIWHEECPSEAVPEQMHDDMVSLFGKEAVLAERELLLSTGAITLINGNAIINNKFYPQLSALVNGMESCMQMFFDDICLTAGEFLRKLGEYLVRKAGAVKSGQDKEGRLSLTWEGAVYELRIAFSPVWLPALSDKAAENNIFVAALCPIAALPWEKTMLRYYEYTSFRKNIAFYDPWNGYKINISKGGLWTYLDWYFRDAHRRKFLIPDAFTQALFDMGLLRYNDEK